MFQRKLSTENVKKSVLSISLIRKDPLSVSIFAYKKANRFNIYNKLSSSCGETTKYVIVVTHKLFSMDKLHYFYCL